LQFSHIHHTDGHSANVSLKHFIVYIATCSHFDVCRAITVRNKMPKHASCACIISISADKWQRTQYAAAVLSYIFTATVFFTLSIHAAFVRCNHLTAVHCRRLQIRQWVDDSFPFQTVYVSMNVDLCTMYGTQLPLIIHQDTGKTVANPTVQVKTSNMTE